MWLYEQERAEELAALVTRDTERPARAVYRDTPDFRAWVVECRRDASDERPAGGAHPVVNQRGDAGR